MNISTVFKREMRGNKKVKEKQEKLNKSLDSIDLEEVELDSLLLHNTDKIIKPIIGNKIIEIIQPTTFNKSKLPFAIWKTDKIKELISQNNLKPVENYLLGVYSFMENYYYSNGNEENLLNILNYFETIIQDKEIANKIINTSFITLLILILKNLSSSKTGFSIKIRICTIIAYLIRYSTMIETPLDELELCSILEKLIDKGEDIELSKRAIATLGEYLFFVATQAEGEEVSSNWIVSKESLNTLLSALDSQRDDTIKFYSLKTIENISALTMIAENYFANSSFLNALIDIFLFSKIHEMRISAIYTISHLIRLNNSLYEVFISKINFSNFVLKYNNEVPKIQQAMINCLIFGSFKYLKKTMIQFSNSFIKQSNSYKSDGFDSLLELLMENLESSSVVLKMKIILLFKNLIVDINSILTLNELKFFLIISKLKKDPSKEIRCAIKFFEEDLILTLKDVYKVLKSSLLNVLNTNTNNKANNINIYQVLKAYSVTNITSKLRTYIYNKDFLEKIVEILLNKELMKDEMIINEVFTILIVFSENKQVIEDNLDFVLNKLFIPVLQSCYL